MVRLYVGNLAEHATEKCLHELFDKYGMAEACCLTKGIKKVFAIVHVENGEAAIAELNGKKVQGTVLKVLKAVDRKAQWADEQ